MARTKFWYFTVTGIAQFPTDMLRYDAAYPVDQTNRHIAPYFDKTAEYLIPRSVNLKSAHEPTIDRWKSFGWTVDKIEARSY